MAVLPADPPAALVADWRWTLLSVIGVALAVTVVLGTLILKSELVRPFESFGPSPPTPPTSGWSR
jgi:putative ABC transport system permease protein